MKWFPHIICVGVLIGLIVLIIPSCKSPRSSSSKNSGEPTYTVRVPNSFDFEHATLLGNSVNYVEIITKEGKRVFITGPAIIIEE